MRFVKIEATNFLSFKNLKYDFQSSPVLIQGENLEDDNQESNGSGKSSLQAAIEFALFKSTSRKVKDVDLINFEEDTSEISLSVECPIRKQIMLIERRIKKKGSGESQLSINGITQYAFADKMVNEIDKFITDWIGISKEDLQNYYIVNKERYKSIFSTSNREKIELINRFSNARLIDGLDKLVDSDVSDLNSQLKSFEQDKNSLISSIKTLYEEKVSELNRDLSSERLQRETSLNEKIIEEEQEINSINIEKKKLAGELSWVKVDLENVLKSFDKFQLIVDSFEKVDFSEQLNELNREISEQESSSKEIQEILKQDRKDISDVEKSLKSIEKDLAGEIVCPKCHHRFSFDKDIDILEVEKEQRDANFLLNVLSKKIKATESRIDRFSNKIDELYESKSKIVESLSFNDRWDERFRKIKRNLNNKKDSCERELMTINRKINNLDERIKSSTDKISLFKNEIKSLKDISIDSVRLSLIDDKIKSKGVELRVVNQNVREKRKEIFETSQWIFNFKKFNMYLANQSLKVIQGYCNKFMQDLKSDIRVRWEGIKMLANGSLREEITSYIIRDNEQRDFWSYSGGERARMEYAMIFTLQEIINKTHKYGGLDFLSTDEIAEGLDSQGLNDLMKAMSELNKTVLVTTHVINRSISKNTLLIRKERGESKIIQQLN